MQQTNVDRALEALEEQHGDDPERATVLRLTRRFKASWLELGEALAEVKRSGSWKRWGYETFDVYAKTELKLRPDTVEKLTAGYVFLHKRAPEVLQRDPIQALPSLHAIDYLRRVEERAAEDETIPKETLVDVRKQILDDGVSVAKVAKLYNDTLFPQSEHDKRESSRKSVKSAATRLRDLVADSPVVSRRIADLVGGALDELLSEIDAKSKKAA